MQEENVESLIIDLMKIVISEDLFATNRSVGLMAKKLVSYENNIKSNPKNQPSGVDINVFSRLVSNNDVKEILIKINSIEKSFNSSFSDEKLQDLAKKVLEN